ncbi:DUF2589 domain-containing protein [Aliikangiella maris]|uniref:DUF2589 domain-containing protein n=2 Tax=Aliikangiella maris TaxID=3162458 RepID=A0ABV2BXK7_9GAMM
MAIGQELASLDFESMIGGPLNAVVRAQTQSAITSVDFIKSVGFQGEEGKADYAPQMVDFEYMKAVEETDKSGNTVLTPKKFKLTVPLLTMLPIPFIRVEETTVDFNAKINSVQESTTSSNHKLNSSLSAKGGWGPVSAKLKVGYSFQKQSTSGSKAERTYSMKVHVRAVQDELPAGTERLLGILENAIEEVPATTTK